MEARDIQDFMKDGVLLAYVDDFTASLKDKNTVYFCNRMDSTFFQSEELLANIKKRFKAKSTLYKTPTFYDLIVWTLSSAGYCINSNLLKCVSDNDVYTVWLFLDTISVSSSPRCAPIVQKAKAGRTGCGFERLFLRKENVVRVVLPISSLPTSVPTDITDTVTGHTGKNNIVELLTEEVVAYAMESLDPISTAVSVFNDIGDVQEIRH